MAFESNPRGALLRLITSLLLTSAAWPWLAMAQGSGNGGAGIYTCVDARGRKLTSDRPIPDCTGREQRVLNRDGSVRDVLPPTLTPEERLAQEAIERRASLQRTALADAVRRDRNLLARYPDQAAHHRARQVALAPMVQAMQTSERRLAKLAADRKTMDSEAEFYVGGSMPALLKMQLDGNDAAVAAQHAATKAQAAEIARVTALYDTELARLQKLLAGAPPGSLPHIETAAAKP